jgi:hypothetical protein
MSTLTVVAYNVLFGDAILICIPERTGRKTIMRHILIDVGNVVGGPDSNSAVFRTVMEDIQRRLDGRPIDLYVMTHEHMDHVQGLLRLHSEGQVIPPIDYAWLTVSSDTNYYKNFPQAEKLRRLQIASYERIQRIALTRGILGIASVQSFLENNNPRRTADCVDFLRNRARLNTSYVHRGFKPAVGKNHPFRDVSLSIWAPELDTSSYYGRARPVMPTVRG